MLQENTLKAVNIGAAIEKKLLEWNAAKVICIAKNVDEFS